MKVRLSELWCQCQGNASAIPHTIAIQQQMTKMHQDAQMHAIWYVGIVLSLYLLGLVIIIRKSGSNERHTALSALSLCFSRAASFVTKRSRSRRRRRGRQNRAGSSIPLASRQLQQLQPMSSGGGFQQQQQPPSRALHLYLEVPEEEREIEVSCVTSVA
ncbi:uncharacterized protein [Macrobrachium rosenbergii]|uniref:uncharacterized protein n=1 Tax=Macrobrachium rosenbergii TaxID=79674 RepID=UPI0034D48664